MSFLFKVVDHNPTHVSVSVSSDAGWPGNYTLAGHLTFTWREWQEFACLHGWKDADIARCKAIVIGNMNEKEQGHHDQI